MRNSLRRNLRAPRLKVGHTLAFTSAMVTASSVVLAEILGLGLLALLRGEITWGLHIGIVIITSAVFGLLLGALFNHSLTRRLRRINNISQAWLRGNLALRIYDTFPDEVCQIGDQLNALAEQLEEDEEDLAVLRERNARLTDQVRALAVVEERNRLARELHDSVKQHLFSLAMTASAIRTHFETLERAPETISSATITALSDMVREIETAAQHAQRETTRLIEDLRPGSLQEQGLAAALNDYTLLFGAQEHLLIYLEVSGDDKRLPPAVAEALYRVVQEALHNVARHAKATRVDVHLRSSVERVTLTIEDNGIGFDTAQRSPGLGLANMQERMLNVGGRLTLESQSGVGTTIMAEVELPYTPTTLPAPTSTAPISYQPDLSVENWAWLGAKLVIPVGQTWPWLPADLRYLHRPLIEPEITPLTCHVSSFLRLGRTYTIMSGEDQAPLARIHRSPSGYEWEDANASWALRRIRGLSGRMVLTRNKQPLAAVQYQGRQMNTWSEIIYDNRGYRLAYTKSDAGCAFILYDEIGQELLHCKNNGAYQITVYRALPLPLLLMTTARIVDELAVML
ncbi:MAG: sensor histidine kinase [Anaerolineae bacterium]